MKKLVLLTALILMTGLAFGQGLQKGNLAGVKIVNLTPNPDVTMNQFVDFIKNKYIPAYEKAHPGIKCYLTKSIRGDNENSYGWIFYIESAEVMLKYWPEPDVESVLKQEAGKKLEPINVERRKFGTWTFQNTDDWVIL